MQYDFASDEIQYYGGDGDLLKTAHWTEWSRISSYETWKAQQQAGQPTATPDTHEHGHRHRHPGSLEQRDDEPFHHECRRDEPDRHQPVHDEHVDEAPVEQQEPGVQAVHAQQLLDQELPHDESFDQEPFIGEHVAGDHLVVRRQERPIDGLVHEAQHDDE